MTTAAKRGQAKKAKPLTGPLAAAVVLSDDVRLSRSPAGVIAAAASRAEDLLGGAGACDFLVLGIPHGSAAEALDALRTTGVEVITPG